MVSFFLVARVFFDAGRSPRALDVHAYGPEVVARYSFVSFLWVTYLLGILDEMTVAGYRFRKENVG
jgi:hypothetical protein